MTRYAQYGETWITLDEVAALIHGDDAGAITFLREHPHIRCVWNGRSSAYSLSACEKAMEPRGARAEERRASAEQPTNEAGF